MARRNVRLNSAGVRELLRSGEVRAELGRRMDRVQAVATRSAPVVTGAYRDSIRRRSATTDRAVEQVVATAPHAHLVESRTGNLARAFNAAGGA